MVAMATNSNIIVPQKYTARYKNVGYGWDTSHPTTISKKFIILIYHYLHTVSIGLVMLGSGSADAIDEMLQYARETQHEKIIRGVAVGIAFICYGKQEQADSVMDKLLKEKNPVLRYGVYSLALSYYAGAAEDTAVEKLVHIAVSDTADDTRRVAVTSFAFLLLRNPGQQGCPRVRVF